MVPINVEHCGKDVQFYPVFLALRDEAFTMLETRFKVKTLFYRNYFFVRNCVKN